MRKGDYSGRSHKRQLDLTQIWPVKAELDPIFPVRPNPKVSME